jgi:hypothetical protein
MGGPGCMQPRNRLERPISQSVPIGTDLPVRFAVPAAICRSPRRRAWRHRPPEWRRQRTKGTHVSPVGPLRRGAHPKPSPGIPASVGGAARGRGGRVGAREDRDSAGAALTLSGGGPPRWREVTARPAPHRSSPRAVRRAGGGGSAIAAPAASGEAAAPEAELPADGAEQSRDGHRQGRASSEECGDPVHPHSTLQSQVQRIIWRRKARIGDHWRQPASGRKEPEDRRTERGQG